MSMCMHTSVHANCVLLLLIFEDPWRNQTISHSIYLLYALADEEKNSALYVIFDGKKGRVGKYLLLYTCNAHRKMRDKEREKTGDKMHTHIEHCIYMLHFVFSFFFGNWNNKLNETSIVQCTCLPVVCMTIAYYLFEFSFCLDFCQFLIIKIAFFGEKRCKYLTDEKSEKN